MVCGQIFEKAANHWPFKDEILTSDRKTPSLKHFLFRLKICCFFENLDVDKFMFSTLHSANKFLNEQQILELTYQREEAK